MKQRITRDQLSELSDKAREKLREWCNEKASKDIIPGSSFILPGDSDARLASYLSIGQMIEFLDEECGAWKMESWQEWEIVDTEMNKNITLSKSAELCDALWQAVKEVLEN